MANLLDFSCKRKNNNFSAGFFFCIFNFIVFSLFPIFKGLANFAVVFYIILGVFIFLRNGFKDDSLLSKNTLQVCLPLFLIFFGVLLCSLYGSADLSEKLNHISKYFRFVGIFFVGVCLHKFLGLRSAIYGFFASMIFTLACIYVSIYFTLPWAPDVPKGWRGDHTMWGDYITQNIMMSFFCVYMLHLFFNSNGINKKLISAVLFLLSLTAVLGLSRGRTGYVMVLSSILVYIFLFVPGKKIKITLVSAAVAGIFLIYNFNSEWHNRVNLAFSEAAAAHESNETSIGARITMWSHAIHLIKDKPLLGYGVAGYYKAWCDSINSEILCAVGKHPHNQFLFFAVQGGLFLLLCYVSVFIAPLIFIIKDGVKNHPMAIVFLAILFVDSMLNAPFWNIREANFFTLMGGVVWGALILRAQKSESEKNYPVL